MNIPSKSLFSPAIRPALRRLLHNLQFLALVMLVVFACAKTPAETSGGDVSSRADVSTDSEVEKSSASATEAVPSTEVNPGAEVAPSTEEAASTEIVHSSESEPDTEAPPSTEAKTSSEAAHTSEVESGTVAAPSFEATPSTNAEPDAESETTTELPTSPEFSTEYETPGEVIHTTASPSPLSIHDIAFVGDSRTLTMATGGRLEFGLIPDSSVFATWGGELTQESAKSNAVNAGEANRKVAVFWYGINDVQSDPEQKLAPQFRANYEAIIDLYRNANPDSEIVILSILSTSVNEKDYYAGQEENIRTYNAELAALCAENGYTYLDITALFTGDDCLAPGDFIHFSTEWYEERFIPTVFGALGIED